jgi:hypothetical protein
MSKWKDTTTYSRGDSDREPQTWHLQLVAHRLCVTRRVHLEGWFVDHPLTLLRPLKSADVKDAQIEALHLLRELLLEAIAETNEALGVAI